MQATAPLTKNQREQNEHARVRALVRFNGLTFHSLAAASFLETAVPQQVDRLAQVFGAHPDIRLWLEETWWPQRAEIGRQLRGYIEATWPEFDWNAAYQSFCETYRPRSGLRTRVGGIALETLGLCAAAAQAALLYRALALCADDPVLRALARRAACDHAGHFDFLRPLFERTKRRERVGFAASWRAVVAMCLYARDETVAKAFHPLADNWNGAPIVPALGYSEYRDRMAQLILRYGGLGLVERWLFRPWLERARVPSAPAAACAKADGWMRMAPQPA